MLKGMGDLGNIMKLQREFKSMQKKLKKMESSAESADGYVKVVVNGEYKIVDIKIDPAVFQEGDSRKLEKSILATINDAMEKSKEYAAGEMSKLTGGMNIPGLTDMLK
ncbi:MAG: YbaB/EbfC family nucleoid-associated protein [Spirochaetota bacterium]